VGVVVTEAEGYGKARIELLGQQMLHATIPATDGGMTRKQIRIKKI